MKVPGALAFASGARACADSARVAREHVMRVLQAARPVLGKLRSPGWALADQCVVSLANFTTIYLFARYLDTPVFGAFVLAYTALLLLTNMQSALIVQPHSVLAAALELPAYRRFTGALVGLQAVYCLSVLVALGTAGAVIARIHSPQTGAVLLALALAAPPWMAQEFVRRALYTRGQYQAAALNDALTYGLQLFGALVLVHAVARWATPASALSVLGLSSLVGATLGAWQLRNHVQFTRMEGGYYHRTWVQVWHFGKWLTAQNGVAWFGAQGHSWLVALLLGLEQLGIYRAAIHLTNLMNPVIQACFAYLPSRCSLAFHAGGLPGLSQWVKRTMRAMLVALAPFCIVLVGFPGAALEFAYGGKFPGTELAVIVALATIAQGIGFSKYPFDLGLLALRSTKSIFYVYLIPVALLLTLGTSLVALLGILGVPLSVMAINSALLAATWFAYRRALQRQAAA